MTTALLQTTYFGPVQWYQKLFRYDRCLIEQHDNYQKQTYRNRCVIATANGLQALTVPVGNEKGEMRNEKCLVRDVRISDHNQWRRVHWNALQSAYNESPFFDYYADDIRPFFEQKYEFLVDFNEAIRQKICELLDIHPHVEYTTKYRSQFFGQGQSGKAEHSILNSQFSILNSQFTKDFRDAIHAKHPQPDADFQPKEYWQVFRHKHGFLPNLSILDLLFCMGPEAIFYL